MERNDGNNDLGAAGQNDANEFSGSGSTEQVSSFDFSGSTASTSPVDAPVTEPTEGLRDRAKDAMGSAGERLSSFGSTVRDRAGTAKNRLADALESGAERLRQQRGVGDSATFAGATNTGTATIETDGKLSQVSERVAGGMQASADWLRDADLDNLKSGVEQQVREHPGRTLLIAAGLGYLIGRAFRSSQ